MVLRKYSLMVEGHATSVSLEPQFWQALQEIAAQRRQTMPQLIASIDAQRVSAGAGKKGSNLSSTLRLLVLAELQAKLKNHDQP